MGKRGKGRGGGDSSGGPPQQARGSTGGQPQPERPQEPRRDSVPRQQLQELSLSDQSRPATPQGAWGGQQGPQAPQQAQRLPPGMPPQMRPSGGQRQLPPGMPPQVRPSGGQRQLPPGMPPQTRPSGGQRPLPPGMAPQAIPSGPQQQLAPGTAPPARPTGPSQQKPAGPPSQAADARGPRELSIYGKGTYEKYKDKLSELKPPRRPDASGKIGRPIRLYANHFALNLGTKTKIVYHYDVEIKDKDRIMENKPMRRKIAFALLTTQTNVFPLHCCVFDGMKSMYTNQKLKITGQQQFTVPVLEDDGREREFSVLVQLVNQIELAEIERYLAQGSTSDIPQKSIQCLDIILRYNQTYNMKYLPVRSSLFNPFKQTLVDLGGGALVWSGHYQSVRMGSTIFLNVDASQKAVYKDGPVVDVMYDVLELDPNRDPPPMSAWMPRQRENFIKYLKGLKVVFRPGNIKREYRVNGLKGPASQEKFDNDGKMITVQQYMKSRYNLDLQYPELPCLWVGNPNKVILVPMEFCDIKPGQVMRGKLDDKQTSTMIKVAAKPPAERRATIENAVRVMNMAQDPVANSFGFAMRAEMMKVMGRILPAPNLEYYGNKRISPRDGKWDMRGNKFLESAGLKQWGVLSTTFVKPDVLNKFIGMLMDLAGRMGMAVEPPLFVKSCKDMARDVEENLTKLKNEHKGLKLVLVPISRKGAEIYKDIKRVGDLLLSLTTQCVVQQNIFKCQDQTVSNILLKVNAKLGGVNNYIQRDSLPKALYEPVLILGADVTHPAPEARKEGKPSIAAVVGSSDARAMKYSGELRLQDPGKEIIEELEDMVYQMLRKFYDKNQKYNGGKPKKIIFYRDGVSEGQFREVLRWEFSAIRRACNKMEKDYSPQITFLVVQKRHNTRLFAERGEPTVGRMGNVPPGTVVDTSIVHKTEFDYFLCSHEGIQGTSRPTHYHILWDENGFTSDELQILTYYLCHLFARCCRSVSNPAPSYYAHLLAFRGRHHHDSYVLLNNESCLSMKQEDGATQSVKNGPVIVQGSPIKIVFLGSPGCGKSALVVRYLTKRFIVEYKSGVDFTYRHVIMQNCTAYELEIVDLSNAEGPVDLGEEYTCALGFVVVYSVTDRISFGFAQRTLQKLRQHDMSKAVLLLGNKLDLNHLREVGFNEGRELGVRYGCTFHEISAADCNYPDLKSIFNGLFQQCVRTCASVRCADESRARKRPVLSVSKMFPSFRRPDVMSPVERRCKSVASSLPDLASTLKEVFKKKSV